MSAAKATGATTKAGEKAIAAAPLFSNMFGIRLLSERKAPTWAKGKSGPISTKYWNYPLLSKRKKEPDHAKDKSGHVSTKWFSYPLLSPRKTRDSAVGKSGHVSTKYWNYPLVTRRKQEPTHAVGKARTILT